MAQALLKVENINKSFAGVQALKNVSLEIMPGEIHCLAGENGCGKSTLIKIISGIHERDSGTVYFNGKQLSKITPIDAIIIMIAWLIFMALTRFQKFYTFGNFQTMASQFPEFGLMSLGVMVCMITGGIDLSCVGIANMTGLLSAMFMTYLAGESGVLSTAMFPLVIVACVVVGAVCGAVNGFLISQVRIPPILATLGVNELLRGLSIVLTGGSAYSSFPKQLTSVLSSNVFGVIPVSLIVFIIAAIAIWFLLEKTTFGTKIRLIGTSEKVAIYSGLKTKKVIMTTYIISGICASLGGIIMLSSYASARADYGSQYTLLAILIVVLGGVSPNGGKGKISGVILAIITLKMLESGINRFQNVSSYYISLIWGGVLILAMVLDYFSTTRKTKVPK